MQTATNNTFTLCSTCIFVWSYCACSLQNKTLQTDNCDMFTVVMPDFDVTWPKVSKQWRQLKELVLIIKNHLRNIYTFINRSKVSIPSVTVDAYWQAQLQCCAGRPTQLQQAANFRPSLPPHPMALPHARPPHRGHAPARATVTDVGENNWRIEAGAA